MLNFSFALILYMSQNKLALACKHADQNVSLIVKSTIKDFKRITDLIIKGFPKTVKLS